MVPFVTGPLVLQTQNHSVCCFHVLKEKEFQKPSRSDESCQQKYPSWLQTAKLFPQYMTCLLENSRFLSVLKKVVSGCQVIEHAIIVQRQGCIVAPRVSDCNSHGHVVDGALAAKHQRKGHQDESWLLVLPLSTFTDNSSKNALKNKGMPHKRDWWSSECSSSFSLTCAVFSQWNFQKMVIFQLAKFMWLFQQFQQHTDTWV